MNFKGIGLPHWLIQTLSDYRSSKRIKRRRRERICLIEEFERRMLLSVAAPTQFTATWTYTTRVDFTWAERLEAMLRWILDGGCFLIARLGGHDV